MTDPSVHHADPGVHDGVIFVFTMVRYPALDHTPAVWTAQETEDNEPIDPVMF